MCTVSHGCKTQAATLNLQSHTPASKSVQLKSAFLQTEFRFKGRLYIPCLKAEVLCKEKEIEL